MTTETPTETAEAAAEPSAAPAPAPVQSATAALAGPLPLDADSRGPLAELLILAAPTVAQMASYTVLQFTDTYMLSRVGEVEATAAGNSGMFSFSFIGFGSGVLTLVNTLVSQNFGRGNYAACGRYLWQGVWFAALFSLAILPSLLLAHYPFTLSGHEPELVRMEVVYYRIMVAGAFFKLAATAFGQFLIGVDRPMLVFLASVAGVVVNVFANWVLIYGKLGAPRLGVAGAAWGTNIAIAAELAVLVAFACAPRVRDTFGLRDWRPRWGDMKTLMRVGLPAGGQFVADIFAWTLFMMTVMGVFGTAVMAANVFAFRFWVVSFMPAFGLSAAVTALVGRYIGRGQPDVAARRAHLGFVVAAVYMLSCGVFFYFARHWLMGLFSDDAEIIRIGATVLVFAAVYQFFDALYIIYNGALRGAGDTLVPALAVFVLCWSIVVAGGYAVARLRTDWGPAGPWTMATVYGAILGTFIFRRFYKGRWKTIRLERPDAADTVPGFPVVPSPTSN